MSVLQEPVVVDTPIARHAGLLASVNHLPVLFVVREGDASPLTPQTFPDCWRLSSLTCGDLYTAWRDIEAVMDRLREAQREAEEPREPDCIDLAKADMEAKGAR